MAGPHQSDRPEVPKPGAGPVQAAKPGLQPVRPGRPFVPRLPAAEPHQPQSLPDFVIEVDPSGDSRTISPPAPVPVPPAVDKRLASSQVSKLLPILARLEREMADVGKVLPVKTEFLRTDGKNLFLGPKQIGEIDAAGAQIRIRLDALGYDIKKLPAKALSVLCTSFGTTSSLLSISFMAADSASLAVDQHNISLCLHKGDSASTFMKFSVQSA
ncbi:MAG: hypothetical protein PHF60_02595 [Candidatus ainarchaeum sp.]|nr:hypothetical protein [Candidatus ainarchaeum sp.]